MSEKKKDTTYLSLTGLRKYDKLIKDKVTTQIDNGLVETLQAAKDYSDSLHENYDEAGQAQTIKEELLEIIDVLSGTVDGIGGKVDGFLDVEPETDENGEVIGEPIALSNLVASIDELENNKVDKDGNKVLSTNDFTDSLKSKLEGIDSGAQTNQNAFSQISFGKNIGTIDAASESSSVSFRGTNISITPDVSNTTIDFEVPGASTSNVGVVQLLDSVESESTEYAATPNSVKQAYDLAKETSESLDENIVILGDAVGAVNARLTRFFGTDEEGGVDVSEEEIDTLEEIVNAIEENTSKISELSDAKVDKVEGKGLSSNDFTGVYLEKLESVEHGAEVNQNAFSGISIDNMLISADKKVDHIELYGSNIEISPEITTDSEGEIISKKIKFSVENATTETAGIVQLIDAVNSSSKDSAATPNSVATTYEYAVSVSDTLSDHADSHKLKTYTSLTQIGLTNGSETIETIAYNMPNNSELSFEVGANHATIYPTTYGLLNVSKAGNDTRVIFKFFQKATAYSWFGVYDSSASTAWTGWVENGHPAGYLSLDGRKQMIGDLTVVTNSNPGVTLWEGNDYDTAQIMGKFATSESLGAYIQHRDFDTSKSTYLYVNANGSSGREVVVRTNDGSNAIFGEHNTELLKNHVLPLDGSKEMTGPLGILQKNGPSVTLYEGESAEKVTDELRVRLYGHKGYFEHRDNETGKSGGLLIDANSIDNGEFARVKIDGSTYSLYGEHNTNLMFDAIYERMISTGMEDLESGVTSLQTGKIHFVFEEE